MPNGFTIGPLSPMPPPRTPPVAEPKPPPVRLTPIGPALAAVVPQIPSVALNSEKGVVVIDFRNDAGKLVNSIPSAQQLATYGAGPARLPVTEAPAPSRPDPPKACSAPPAPRSGKETKSR
ncbi:MAG: hypothetical protein ACREFN_15125 [Acetobacteraceae bacterium]